MGQRNAERSGRADAGGDAGDYLHLDIRGAQRLQLLAAATENEGIAAFQPRHDLALPCVLHQQALDEFLRRVLTAAALADLDDLGARARMRQAPPAHQVVDQHDVGDAECPRRLERHQLRVARSCADEEHLAAH